MSNVNIDFDKYDYCTYNDKFYILNKEDSHFEKSFEIALGNYIDEESFNYSLTPNDKNWIDKLLKNEEVKNFYGLFKILNDFYIKNKKGSFIKANDLYLRFLADKSKGRFYSFEVTFFLEEDLNDEKFKFFNYKEKDGYITSEFLFKFPKRREYFASEDFDYSNPKEFVRKIVKDILKSFIELYKLDICYYDPTKGLIFLDGLFNLSEKVYDEKVIKKNIIEQNFG